MRGQSPRTTSSAARVARCSPPKETTMIRESCKIAILAMTLLPAVFAQAQTSAPALPSKRVIYVLDFDHQGVASRDDIDDFAEQLLILRLVQLKSYNVEKRDRDKEPPCLKEARAVSLDPQQVTIGSDASYYSVKASIHVREPGVGAREATLEYELRKCRANGVFISLAQSNQTFAYTDVLRQLNGMADAVSFLLEQEQQVTKISVGFKGVSGAGWSRLGEMILDRLKDAQEFEPRLIDTSTPSNPPADYTFSGRVFSQSSKLWFEVEVPIDGGYL